MSADQAKPGGGDATMAEQMAPIPDRHGRQRRRRSVIVVVAVAAAILGGVAIWKSGASSRETRFDPVIWQASPTREDPDFKHPVRQRMVDDLIRRRLLSGGTRDAVESLLGPPDDTAYFREYDLVYMLGPERRSLFSIDDEWLVIRFDSSGRASEVRLVTD